MKLLVTGAWRDGEKKIPELREQGHEIVFLQNETDALPCDPGWIEGVVCNGLFLTHDIRRFTSLRMIQLTSAGMDRVPVDYCSEHGVRLYTARGVYSVPMAEHAVAAVLHFFRNSRTFFDNQRRHLWLKDRELRELCGSTVCIIGCGSVGTECAKRFSAFGCTVCGVDIVCSDKEYFTQITHIDNLYRAVSSADAVIFTLPLTDRTEGLADDNFFRALKDGCVVVNIARGAIIRTDALIRALTQRELYAALDVFEEEPLAEDSPLWDMDHMIITPHNSFVGDGNAARLNTLITENLSNEQKRDQTTD